MKKKLPKKSATQAVKPTPATENTLKKTPAAKPVQTAAKAAAIPASKAKPAAATKPVSAAKPASAFKPVVAKPAPVAKSAAAKPVATAKPVVASNGKKSPAANGKEKKPLPVTTFVAQVEIGWGNSLYLRGEGAPELSWERGILMKWEDGSWVYSTTGAKVPVAFKFLINDSIWAEGHNQHVEAGSTSITTPHFHH